MYNKIKCIKKFKRDDDNKRASERGCYAQCIISDLYYLFYPSFFTAIHISIMMTRFFFLRSLVYGKENNMIVEWNNRVILCKNVDKKYSYESCFVADLWKFRCIRQINTQQKIV